MTDLFFHEGAGLIFHMRLPGQRRALRVSTAETCLTVYRRRLVAKTLAYGLVQMRGQASLDRKNFGPQFFKKFLGKFLELSNLFLH